ncbi:ABC transporter ATP-binding protein [Thioalkalivibrio sp. HK1]|uniref:ABC transporter ATP-binding protein n=1 Tax=Thioalkalivibrio sp. HK1 TaxID=1469245 RepID=UPI000470738E|nr:ABC transporter ATP-binding protein [Thioalkalivibrio sp. HK1]
MAEIVIENLCKRFGAFTAVKESSFTIEDGEFFMLLGPSGCGKTTTLRMIAGLEIPSGGKIYLDGEEISRRPPSQRDIAFVFQMFALYPHLNVRKNIGYPLASQGMKRRERTAKILEVAKILGIEDILDHPVSGLSGGDRQRVALGRAIVRNPKAFMMDEPLGALDAEFRERMALELRALHDRMGATTVYVTHDQLEAMQMGDKIVVMNNAVVEQFGTPKEIYEKPESLFVADFIGSPSMNFLDVDGAIAEGQSQVSVKGIPIAVPQQHESAAGDVILGIRPEHIRFSDRANPSARVCAIEYLGTTQVITLQSDAGSIKARVDSSQSVEIGERVGLEFESCRISLFSSATGKVLRSALHGRTQDG